MTWWWSIANEEKAFVDRGYERHKHERCLCAPIPAEIIVLRVTVRGTIESVSRLFNLAVLVLVLSSAHMHIIHGVLLYDTIVCATMYHLHSKLCKGTYFSSKHPGY